MTRWRQVHSTRSRQTIRQAIREARRPPVLVHRVACLRNTAMRLLGRSLPCIAIFAILFFVFTIFLWAINRVASVTLLANLLSFIMTIALRIGGSRIVAMLEKGAAGSGDKKSAGVAKAMKQTYSIMIWSQPMIIFAGAWYTMDYQATINTGERQYRGLGIACSTVMMTCCLQITIFAMIDFVYKVRVNGLKKVEGTTDLMKSSVATSTASSIGSP